MLLLYLFYFSSVYDPTSLYLSNGRKIKERKRYVLSETKSSWYFANLNTTQFDFDQLEKFLNITIKSSLILDSNWCNIYLSPDEYQTLVEKENIKLYPVEPEDKIQFQINEQIETNTDKNNTYVVKAHESFSQNDNSLSSFHNIKHLFETYFEVETNNLIDLANDPKVLAINKHFNVKLQNRWVHSFLQNGDETISFDEPGPRGHRTLDLDGNGSIITIMDTGVDKDHAFFKDSTKSFPFNTLDMTHRKVVRYITIGDDKDKMLGHGTHCAGSIAGYAECGNCSINLYKGSAPMAKLQVIDFYVDSNKSVSSPISFQQVQDTVEMSNQIKSHIISCSWGSDSNPAFTAMIDELMTTDDEVAMVFAAGNNGNYYSILSPSDSKNVITVGATSSPLSTSIEFKRNCFLLKSGETSSKIFANDASLYMIMTNDINRTYNNLEIVQFDEGNENYDNKIVVVTNENDIKKSISRNAQVIVYVSSTNIHTPPEKTAFLYFKGGNEKAKEILELKSASVRFEPVSNVSQFYSSVFSSKGPTLRGLLKPDISAPGEHIFSSATKSEYAIRESSGTSMATPSISGCLALIEQYFREKRHGLPVTDNLMKNYFLKAVLIQSTKSVPTTAYGHGLPQLNSTLVFPPYDNNLGLRFFRSSIASNEHIAFNITTGKGQFKCTLCWNDLATQTTAPILFADLDLYVVLQNGTIVYGNMGEDTDALSTVEKVMVKIEEDEEQKIEVHIVANEYAIKKYKIPFAFVCNGNFSHTNTTKNPITPEIIKLPNTYQCSQFTAGNNCQFPIETLSFTKTTTFNNVSARSFKYTKFSIEQNLKKYITVNINVRDNTDKLLIIRSIIRTDHSRKMNYPQGQVLAVQGHNATFYLKSSALSQYKSIYFAFFIDGQHPSTVDVTLGTSIYGPNSIRKWGQFPSFTVPTRLSIIAGCSVLTAGIAIVSYGIIMCIRRTEARNEIPVNTPRVRVTRQDLAEIEEPLQP